MGAILQGYSVNPATWFYLSLLLIIAVFFRFNRLWSLRNLDLGLLLSASPGLLMVEAGGGSTLRTVGYSWLFAVSAVILLRLLLDPVLTRRPLYSQNLNGAGLAFLCVCAFVFLTAQAVTKTTSSASLFTGADAAATLLDSADSADAAVTPQEAAVVSASPAAPVELVAERLGAPAGLLADRLTVRLLSMVAHLAVVLGLFTVGQRLFCDVQSGWGMATLYLLLPCTAYDVGKFHHVLPSALILWAFVAYRQPLISGALLGLACGSMYFPIFLLPVWAAFYGRRGWVRFVGAICGVMAVMLGSLALTSSDAGSFYSQAVGTLDLAKLAFRGGHSAPMFWDDTTFLSVYRIPIIVAYFIMLISTTIWPRHKSVEHLLAYTSAIVVGTQFWYTQQGGIYLLWYLPLLLMAVFRPRLTHLRPPASEDAAEAAVAQPFKAGSSPRSGAALQRMHLFR